MTSDTLASPLLHKYGEMFGQVMSPAWKITKPRNDTEYFERMTKTVFNAGLNWTVVEKKWPDFRRSFTEFSPSKVARFSEKKVKALMNNEGIVRNEKKIRATVHNAGQFLKLEKELPLQGTFRRPLP